jgi:hypothetical protein
MQLQLVSLDYTNNGTAGCLIQGSVVGVITSNYDECGGDITQVWTFTDDCGKNITIHRRITVDPAPIAAFINPTG